MIDIIIVIGCILGGFVIGKFFERRISEKGAFYKDLTRYLSLLKDNVNGKQLELSGFNEEFSKNCGRSFADFIATKQLKLKIAKPQKDNISSFFDHLDCVSSQALVEHINYYGKILADDAEDVFRNEVAKSSIYGKLGMLLGAMLGILLI